jgi:nucleoside-diphosphate-sugar epimerase
MLHGQSPLIYGDGEQSRDFIFVENVVEANIRAGESDATALAVNIGCGQRTSLNQLVSVLNEILSSNFEPEYLEVRPGDIRHSEGDISLAREGIGFEPSIDFKTGLEKTIEYYRSQEG